MSWEPDSEEIKLRKQNDEIERIRQRQYISSGINNRPTSNNIGTVSGSGGFNWGTVGDTQQTVSNDWTSTTYGSLEAGFASFVKVLEAIGSFGTDPTSGCATIHILNGGGTSNAGIVGQKITLKPELGKTICLIDRPTTSDSTGGNLILGSDITLTDKQVITLRFQNDVTFSDGVGGWVIDSSSAGASSSSGSDAIKNPCRFASTGNNAFHPVWNMIIDGVVEAQEGNRILVKNQTTGQDNGIYVVGVVSGVSPLATATLTRATDFTGGSIQKGSTLVAVQEGTTNADTLWQLSTNETITVGTTSLSFTQFSGGGADNLGNHTATQALRMQDYAIFLDVATLQSILSLAGAINYVNDIVGGSHDFYINDLVIPKFGITETSIESNVTLDMNGKNIISTVNPATDEFRIVFDAHDDSDTYISNSTTADRINIASNGVNIVAFRPTDVLMGIKLDMNTFDIQTVGNIDFGTGSPTSGRIRIPNTASIKWESLPTGDEGELMFDVDGKFFWRAPATGEFGFWHGGFNTLNITSTGIDLLFNNISNARLGTDLDARNFNLTSTSTPTIGEQFRIVFDGHDDSDTYLSNSTTADRISVVSNGTAILEISPTELLVESTYRINMNTANITTIGSIDFGAGSPTSGRIRIPNTASIIWESVAPTGNYGEMMFDVDEKFFWAVPSGGAFGFWEGGLLVAEITASGINMQLNTVDNVRNIEVNSNTTTAGIRDVGFTSDPTSPLAGELYYNTTSNVWRYYNGGAWNNFGGSTSFIGFTGDADLDMNNFNIKSIVAPTAGDQFRIVFDAHDDSDTYIANSTTADRINIVNNGVNTMAFRSTDVLMGIKIDMNTFDIETVGNLSFGTGSSTSGRIRLPNTASIKWASSPAGTDGEISYDVDENFFFATSATGDFGFWNDGFNTLNITSDGIDMLLNRITNVRSIVVDSIAGEAGFRDLGHTADPTSPLAGEMYYNTTTNQMKFYNNSSWVAMDGGGVTSFADNVFDIHDNTTPTKILQFQLSTFIAGTSLITSEALTVGAKIWTLPNQTGTFILNAGSQTITGIKKFEHGNFLIEENGGANTGAFVTATLSADRTYTFPDITGTVGLLEGTQTVSGAKTFTASTFSVTSANITLGDATSDNIGVVAQFTTDLIPDANLTYDLGNTSLRWLSVYSQLVLYDASHSITMDASKVRITVSGAGDKFEIHDGSSVRIEYDYSTDDFSPVDNIASLGKSGRRWVDVWAVNGTIQTSFTPFKTNIIDVDTAHCLDVCNALKPIKYKWRPEHLSGMKPDKKEKELAKQHMGFSADALKTMCPDSVAGDDGVYQGSIIGHMLGAIQELTKQVNTLKTKK